MAETEAPPPLPKSQPSFARRQSTIIKLLGVGALVLVLLIPLVMITGVLSDRLSRRNEAVAESIGTNSDSVSYSFGLLPMVLLSEELLHPIRLLAFESIKAESCASRGRHFICQEFLQTILFSWSSKLAGSAPSQNWGPSREPVRP